MRAFIYDKYGYYPNDEYVTSFEYEGWYFKLELSEKNDYEIHQLRLLLNEINHYFPDNGTDIIMTRDGHYVSNSEYGPVILVAIKNSNVNYLTLVNMHQIYNQKFNNKLTISHLRDLWINKVNSIEERILSSLIIDDKEYSKLYVLGQYAIGLAENAIQYLLDASIYYGDEIKNTSLCHKRIDKLDSFYLFNPFNLIIESPMRDLAELYKNDLITLDRLYDLFKYYNLTIQDASILLARCLFPNQIFDILEDYYELKKDVRARINNMEDNISKKEIKLKKIHSFLVKHYSIRPISWLETK